VLRIAGYALAVAASLEGVGWWRARRWQVDPAEEFEDASGIAVLDIGLVMPGALHQ